LGCFQAEIIVRSSPDDLIRYIDRVIAGLNEKMVVAEVSQIKIIAETKEAYRKLGKDPSRYRPSAEALTRRVLQGKGLYRVNNIVDSLNIISILHGFSIGGYDLEMLNREIVLGIGEAGEPFDAIGRGMLNIEHLPVLRDATGAFGSPTSDSIRTMVREHSKSLLLVFFDFMHSGQLESVMEDAVNIFHRYSGVTQVETWIVM
jgi:DNA/RNA-binding domain of Phe-tRNA-synthetase-like protein